MSAILYGPKHNRFPKFELDWTKCGTASNYRAHYRRGEKPCRRCREAEAQRSAAKRAAMQPLAANDPRHGTRNAYNTYHCRCDACRGAAASYRRAYYRSRLGRAS